MTWVIAINTLLISCRESGSSQVRVSWVDARPRTASRLGPNTFRCGFGMRFSLSIRITPPILLSLSKECQVSAWVGRSTRPTLKCRSSRTVGRRLPITTCHMLPHERPAAASKHGSQQNDPGSSRNASLACHPTRAPRADQQPALRSGQQEPSRRVR